MTDNQNLPCIDCITLPICKAQVCKKIYSKDNQADYATTPTKTLELRVIALFKKCSLLSNHCGDLIFSDNGTYAGCVYNPEKVKNVILYMNRKRRDK